LNFKFFLKNYRTVADFSHRKTANAKSAVLKNAIKPPEYYTFSETITSNTIFIEMLPCFQVNFSMKLSKKCFVRNGIQFQIGR